MKDGAEVLKQIDFQQGKDLKKLDREIEDIETKLAQRPILDQIIGLIRKKYVLDEYFHLQSSYEIVIK